MPNYDMYLISEETKKKVKTELGFKMKKVLGNNEDKIMKIINDNLIKSKKTNLNDEK